MPNPVIVKSQLRSRVKFKLLIDSLNGVLDPGLGDAPYSCNLLGRATFCNKSPGKMFDVCKGRRKNYVLVDLTALKNSFKYSGNLTNRYVVEESNWLVAQKIKAIFCGQGLSLRAKVDFVSKSDICPCAHPHGASTSSV